MRTIIPTDSDEGNGTRVEVVISETFPGQGVTLSFSGLDPEMCEKLKKIKDPDFIKELERALGTKVTGIIGDS